MDEMKLKIRNLLWEGDWFIFNWKENCICSKITVISMV